MNIVTDVYKRQAFVLVAFFGINAVWVILAGILAGEISSVVNKGGLKE